MKLLRLEYLPTNKSRVWRKASITMRLEGRAQLELTAAALKAQEKWHDWRIVETTP
jgi:hypothetical protein